MEYMSLRAIYSQACRTVFSTRSQGSLNAVVKGCKVNCAAPETNLPAGSGQTYCCFGDFCNEGLTFSEYSYILKNANNRYLLTVI